jgi:phosphate/phosphite/phosphonate ABC transporter binding protein
VAALRFGLIPRGDDGDACEREFVAAAAEALGREVGVHRAADYRGVLSGLQLGLVDFAWLPPIVGARALSGRLVEIAATVQRHGDSSYRTALVARAGSPIRTLSQLRDLRVAWVDRESASGYAVLRIALMQAGVQLTRAFKDEVFLRSHAAVAKAVLRGQVDVGATCTHASPAGVRYARSSVTGDTGVSSNELQTVFEAGPIPSDVFAVRSALPHAVGLVLGQALLQGSPERLRAAARALTHADAFARPTPEHRRSLDALLEV